MSAPTTTTNRNPSKMIIVSNLRAQRKILRQTRAELFEKAAVLLESYSFEVSQAEGMAAIIEEEGKSNSYVQLEVLYGKLELLGKDIMEIHDAISELLKGGMRKGEEF